MIIQKSKVGISENMNKDDSVVNVVIVIMIMVMIRG